MNECTVEIKETAMVQAITQGGELRDLIVGDDIWSPNRHLDFETNEAAFEWRDELRDLDEGDGIFTLRSTKMKAKSKADQTLVYRED